MTISGEVAVIGRTMPLGVVRNAHWYAATPRVGPLSAFYNTHGHARDRGLAAGMAVNAPARAVRVRHSTQR